MPMDPETLEARLGHVVVLASTAPSLVNFRGPLLSALVSSGYSTTAVAPDVDPETRETLQAIGVRVVELGMQRTGMNPVSDLLYFGNLRRQLEDLQPDVLIAYTAKPVIWGALAARCVRRKIRSVSMITGLGYAFTPPEQPSLRHKIASLTASLLYGLAMRSTDIVLFQNCDDEALFRSRGLLPPRLPTRIMPGSGVDLTHYAPVALPTRLTFLMIARLLAAKGAREYIEASLSLKERFPYVSFRYVGGLDEGPDAIAGSELKGWTNRGLEYLGSVADVRPEIAQASCIVLPSYREGTPRSVLEAMAMGRPIITTDAPGCRETVIDGENGWLISPREVAPLIAAMEQVIRTPDALATMGSASRKIAEDRFDVRLANAVVLSAVHGEPPQAPPFGHSAATMTE